MKRIFSILVLSLSGCATSSQVVQAGRDTWMVSSHVAGCVNCSASVQSLTTANAFCGKHGKVVSIRNSRSTTNPFGYEVGNELMFSCIDENDPENTRPILRQDKGVLTIEGK